MAALISVGNYSRTFKTEQLILFCVSIICSFAIINLSNRYLCPRVPLTLLLIISIKGKQSYFIRVLIANGIAFLLNYTAGHMSSPTSVPPKFDR